MTSNISVVNWGRSGDPQLTRRLKSIDPDKTSPLTNGEIESLSAAQLKKLEALFEDLRAAGLVATGRQKNFSIEKAGPVGYPHIDEALAFGSTREFTEGSTLVSKANTVTPILSDALAGPDDRRFDDAIFDAIDGAKKFIAVTAFGFDREDIVERLIEKAKAGVDVAVLVDPANESREARKAEMIDKLRSAGLKNLKVADYPVVSARDKSEFDQILHVKKLIADTPDGGVMEISGGINYGETSTFNADSALETHGVAALDCLREFFRHYHHATGKLPFDVAHVPNEDAVRAAALARIGSGKPTRVELAGTERREPPKPDRFTVSKLKQYSELGQRIVISSKQLVQRGVAEQLRTARANGSDVIVVEEPMNALKTGLYLEARKKLRRDGIITYPADARLIESSYHRVVLRELELAKQSGESIDLLAFALSDNAVLTSLIEAHEAGCTVRVAVDDLTIDGLAVNRSAIARLTAAGIEVRGFDDDVAAAFAERTGLKAEEIKLHSKLMVLGQNRVLSGSANFSNNGFQNNVETGRLVSDANLARKLTESVFESVWGDARELHGVETVPFEKRVDLTEPPSPDTPIEDLVFLVFDTETTGFVPGHDERLLSVSFEARRYRRDGTSEAIANLDAYIDPGTDAFGQPFAIPQSSIDVHGLSSEKLAELGAEPVREVAPRIIELLQTVANEGPVVATGQNTAFDLRFLDFLLSRPELGSERDGETIHYRMGAPFVDTAQVSEKLFPNSFAHDLDSLIKRLKVPTRKNLPRHAARADVVYTADALGKLIARGKIRTLGDLLGPDRIKVTRPAPLWATESGGESGYRFDFNKSGNLIVELEAENETRTIKRIDVVDAHGRALEIEATISWRGEERTISGFIDADAVTFSSPGKNYEKLRQAGVELARPSVLE